MDLDYFNFENYFIKSLVFNSIFRNIDTGLRAGTMSDFHIF